MKEGLSDSSTLIEPRHPRFGHKVLVISVRCLFLENLIKRLRPERIEELKTSRVDRQLRRRSVKRGEDVVLLAVGIGDDTIYCFSVKHIHYVHFIQTFGTSAQGMLLLEACWAKRVLY